MKLKLQTLVDVKDMCTDDNAINVDVLPPQQADGNATNPEQLFAAVTLHALMVLLILF